MELNLATVYEMLHDARAKWYDIGLVLKVPVGTLEYIQKNETMDQLRITLKAWLDTDSKPTWQFLVAALKNKIVNEPTIASDIEAKLQSCPAGMVVPQVQQSGLSQQLETSPGHADMQIQALRQKLETKSLELENTQKQNEELQQEIKDLKRRVFQLNQQLQASNSQNCIPQETIQDLNWQKCADVPENMLRGTAVSDGTMAYFNSESSSAVFAYDSEMEKWTEIPSRLPHTQSSLVIIQHTLTTVGGCVGKRKPTSAILSLTKRRKTFEWSVQLPPMPTERYWTSAVVCSERVLTVAGGYNGHATLNTVEVLDLKIKKWFTAANLPQPCKQATVTIHKDKLYLLGGYDNKGCKTASVYAHSVDELLPSQSPNSQPPKWHRATNAPCYWSTCATLCGQLIVVGGSDEAEEYTKVISIYNERLDAWAPMRHMKIARCEALVAVLPGSRLMVVGGLGGRTVVEIATPLF